MKAKQILWLALFVLAGCSRGCTTCTRVVERSGETRTINGKEVEIAIEKLKVTTAFLDRIRLSDVRQEFPIQIDGHKEVSFCYNFKLNIDGREEIEVSMQAPTEEQAPIQDALKAFELIASPDNTHFASFMQGSFWEMYHLLPQGQPFASNWENEVRLSSDTIPANLPSMANFPWKKIPAPIDLAKTLINTAYNMGLSRHQQNTFIASLRSQAPGNPLDFELLNNYPIGEPSTYVLGEVRCASIAKASGQWREMGIKKSLDLLNTVSMKNHALPLLFGIADNPTLEQADDLLLPHWLENNDDYHACTEYVSRRSPMLSEAEKELLKNKALAYLEFKHPQTPPAQVLPWTAAVDWLLASGQHLPEIEKGTALLLSTEMYRTDASQRQMTDDYLFKVYTQFSEGGKKMLVEHYAKSVSEGTDQFERGRQFQFLLDKASCEQLREWKNKYAEQLGAYGLPSRCGGS